MARWLVAVARWWLWLDGWRWFGGGGEGVLGGGQGGLGGIMKKSGSLCGLVGCVKRWLECAAVLGVRKVGSSKRPGWECGKVARLWAPGGER